MSDKQIYNFSNKNRSSYAIGISFSFIVHVLCGFLVLATLENRAAEAFRVPQVFSVTLEGGKVLGGISQVPDRSKKNKKAKPPTQQKLKKVKAPKPKKIKIEKPTVVKQKTKPKKKKIKPKKKVQKKRIVKPKKQVKPKKKVVKKPKPKPTPKRETAAERLARQKALDKKLRNAISSARKRYAGESAKAGGQGFGAARLGGKGMGGGRIASIEFIAYRNALEKHIKDGWRWLPGARVFQAQVLVHLLKDGKVAKATISASSGNGHFDDSVLRAIYKASPVPAPPARLYNQFREVRITFNSHE